MGSTRSHPLPVEMPATSNEFDDWTEKDFDEEIDRLNKRLKEIESERVHVDKEKYDGEVRVMTEEEVQNDPEMTAQVDKVDDLRAHFC